MGVPTPVCGEFAKVLGPARGLAYRSELLAPFLPPRRGYGGRGTPPGRGLGLLYPRRIRRTSRRRKPMKLSVFEKLKSPERYGERPKIVGARWAEVAKGAGSALSPGSRSGTQVAKTERGALAPHLCLRWARP